VCVLQVTGATGNVIRTRGLVSAVDSPTLWDLRCLVRERLVSWVQDRHPYARPTLRAELGDLDGTTEPDGTMGPARRWTQTPHPAAPTRPATGATNA
jgi:hypothetical protein